MSEEVELQDRDQFKPREDLAEVQTEAPEPETRYIGFYVSPIVVAELESLVRSGHYGTDIDSAAERILVQTLEDIFNPAGEYK